MRMMQLLQKVRLFAIVANVAIVTSIVISPIIAIVLSIAIITKLAIGAIFAMCHEPCMCIASVFSITLLINNAIVTSIARLLTII